MNNVPRFCKKSLCIMPNALLSSLFTSDFLAERKKPPSGLREALYAMALPPALFMRAYGGKLCGAQLCVAAAFQAGARVKVSARAAGVKALFVELARGALFGRHGGYALVYCPSEVGFSRLCKKTAQAGLSARHSVMVSSATLHAGRVKRAPPSAQDTLRGFIATLSGCEKSLYA